MACQRASHRSITATCDKCGKVHHTSTNAKVDPKVKTCKNPEKAAAMAAERAAAAEADKAIDAFHAAVLATGRTGAAMLAKVRASAGEADFGSVGADLAEYVKLMALAAKAHGVEAFHQAHSVACDAVAVPQNVRTALKDAIAAEVAGAA